LDIAVEIIILLSKKMVQFYANTNLESDKPFRSLLLVDDDVKICDSLGRQISDAQANPHEFFDKKRKFKNLLGMITDGLVQAKTRRMSYSWGNYCLERDLFLDEPDEKKRSVIKECIGYARRDYDNMRKTVRGVCSLVLGQSRSVARKFSGYSSMANFRVGLAALGIVNWDKKPKSQVERFIAKKEF